MISCKFVVAAETIIRDGETNSISIISLLENLHSPSFPLFIPKLSILWIFDRDEGDPEVISAEVVFTINDNELNRFPIGINFQGGLHTRSIAALNGYVISEPGVMQINLVCENIEVPSFSINIDSLNDPIVNVVNA